MCYIFHPWTSGKSWFGAKSSILPCFGGCLLPPIAFIRRLGGCFHQNVVTCYSVTNKTIFRTKNTIPQSQSVQIGKIWEDRPPKPGPGKPAPPHTLATERIWSPRCSGNLPGESWTRFFIKSHWNTIQRSVSELLRWLLLTFSLQNCLLNRRGKPTFWGIQEPTQGCVVTNIVDLNQNVVEIQFFQRKYVYYDTTINLSEFQSENCVQKLWIA